MLVFHDYRHDDYMVRGPIVENISSYKGEILSCDESIVVTDYETSEMICQKCGKVLQEDVSDNRKERTFPGEKDNSQVGEGTSLAIHDRGLSTIIGRSNTDFVGRRLSSEMKQSMYRMRLLDSRSQTKSSSEKNLRVALYEMYKLRDKLGLSDAIIERAAYIYRKAAKAHLVRGRSIRSMVGACVYVACREMDKTRTIIDISNQLQEKPKLIAKSYRILFHNLKLTVPVPDVINCIIKIANNLEISENTTRKAIHIFDTLKERRLTAGKKPDAVAATVIYMAGIKRDVSLSQLKISKVSGITGVTIRNRYKDYMKYVDVI